MSNLKAIFKEDFDKGDKWGSAMVAFFTVAAELSYREGATPPKWQYRPSPVTHDPREEDDHLYQPCIEASDAELIQFGNVLERYTRNLDRIGESY